MTVTQLEATILARITAIYPDQFFTNAVILAEINTLLGELARKESLCIPGLQEDKIVTFQAYEDADYGYEAEERLPADFGHDLFRARNLTQDADVTVWRSINDLRGAYSGKTLTGVVESLAFDAEYLYPRYCPTTEEDVRIWYYRIPDDLADDEDEPDWLPAELHQGLIVDGVMARLLERITEEVRTGGRFMQIHGGRHQAALADLKLHCKHAPHAVYYRERPVRTF